MSNGRSFRRRRARCCDHDDMLNVTIPDPPAYVDMIGDPATDNETAEVAALVLLGMPGFADEVDRMAGHEVTAAELVAALRRIRAAGISFAEMHADDEAGP